jgi:hypothetical protein
MLFSQILPIPLLLHLITPPARISAIYCRVRPFSGQEPAPRGYRFIGRHQDTDLYIVENLATGNRTFVDREDITNVKAFITWEI